MFFRGKRKRDDEEPPPRADRSDRLYAIGDIHGRVDLLNSLVDTICGDAERVGDARLTRLIFLGDYVDRGDASRQVLDALINLSRVHPRSVFLMGNHEAALLNFVQEPAFGARWIEMGGRQTLASFGVPVPVLRPKKSELVAIHRQFLDAIDPYLDFLRNLPLFEVSGDVVFCHAGVKPARPLPEQTARALLWGHPDALVDMPLPGKRVVHGHFDNATIVDRPGRLCIDTGAYYSGILTAVRFDEGETILQTGSSCAADL